MDAPSQAFKFQYVCCQEAFPTANPTSAGTCLTYNIRRDLSYRHAQHTRKPNITLVPENNNKTKLPSPITLLLIFVVAHVLDTQNKYSEIEQYFDR